MIEQLFNLFAPHLCCKCRKEGSLLCKTCESDLVLPPTACLLCRHELANKGLCQVCHKNAAIDNLYAITTYNETAKALIRALKFERARAGSQVIARLMNDKLSAEDISTIDMVTYAPTAYARRRMRGYDQSALIARWLGRGLGIAYGSLLYRQGKTRQVGASRSQRLAQMENAFVIRQVKLPSHVLLIDDVMTTGATLQSAVRILRQAGVEKVSVIVFAVADH